MTDTRVVTDLLVDGRPAQGGYPGPRHVELLDDGLVHLDYGDSDHVFLASITRVPRVRRRRTPPEHLGVVDGQRVDLVEMTVANHVAVLLQAEPTQDPQSSRAGWPAERLMSVLIGMSDDVGTRYSFFSGEAGSDGPQRRALQRFRPAPPPTAGRLYLTFRWDQQVLGHVDVDLSAGRDAGTCPTAGDL